MDVEYMKWLVSQLHRFTNIPTKSTLLKTQNKLFSESFNEKFHKNIHESYNYSIIRDKIIP